MNKLALIKHLFPIFISCLITVPSLSTDTIKISPAPNFSIYLDQSLTSLLVPFLPLSVNAKYSPLLCLIASIQTTIVLEPNILDASEISLGFSCAAVLMETLSAPANNKSVILKLQKN